MLPEINVMDGRMVSVSTVNHLDMPRTAGAAVSRLHGNTAGEVAVSASYDVDGVPRRDDVMALGRFHSTASLSRLRNHYTQATRRNESLHE